MSEDARVKTAPPAEPMETPEPERGALAEPLRALAEVSLLLDVGSAWSKASVVGRARGRWRVVAHAAQPTAWGEASLVASVADRLHASVDTRLSGELDAILAGAPRIACRTPGRPGRMAIAAVTSQISGEAARRAAESAGWVVVAQVAADDGRPLPDRLATLMAAEVDAWLIAGGFDNARPEQALEAAGMVAAARGGGRSPVVWGGSAALADDVAALFAEGVVTSVRNPRPTAREESLDPLRHHLEELLNQVMETGGTRSLAPIAFRRAVAEIAREERLQVGAVDLGARYATWIFADGRTDPVAPESRVFAAGGLGSPTLAAPGTTGHLVRMLALPVDELAVADTLQNMRSRPGTMPYTDEELAVTRAAGQLLLTALGENLATETMDVLIGAGRLLAASPTPMHALQLLLDGVRPLGVTQLAVDAAGLLGPLGSLPDAELREGIGMLRDDLLVPLGTSVVVRGGRAGQPAVTARLHRAGWPDPEPMTIRGGQVAVLPLPRGERAELQLELAPGTTLPGARRAHHLRVEVSGGVVGLVLDARDVPMALPRRLDDRRAILAGWRDLLLREPVARDPHAIDSSLQQATPEPSPLRAVDRVRRWRPRASFLRGAWRQRGAGAHQGSGGDEHPAEEPNGSSAPDGDVDAGTAGLADAASGEGADDDR